MLKLKKHLWVLEQYEGPALEDGLPNLHYVLHDPGNPDDGKLVASIVRKADGKGFEPMVIHKASQPITTPERIGHDDPA